MTVARCGARTKTGAVCQRRVDHRGDRCHMHAGVPAREPSENDDRPPPPSHLSTDAAELWRQAIEAYSLHPEAHLPILQKACESYDRAEACRRQIEADGLVVATSRGALTRHPLLTVEDAARREFRIAWTCLGLEADD